MNQLRDRHVISSSDSVGRKKGSSGVNGNFPLGGTTIGSLCPGRDCSLTKKKHFNHSPLAVGVQQGRGISKKRRRNNQKQVNFICYSAGKKGHTQQKCGILG